MDALFGVDASFPTRPFITPPVAMTDLNYAGEDDDPTLPDDQLEIYFTSNRSGAGDIYRSVRPSTTAGWSVPVAVTELTTAAIELTPEISADGLTLYFARDTGTLDIHVSTRATRTSPWSPPTLVSELSTALNDDSAVISPDGLVILVTRYETSAPASLWIATRPTPTSSWGAPVRATDLDAAGVEPNQAWLGERVVFYTANALPVSQEPRAALRTGPTSFGPPTPILELDLPGPQSDPWLSSDLGTIYFESEDDLYMTTRAP
ncbi:MAG: PD40 domain-containing protein [Deltaproteobacteria bacterium]|nr:PD40 domain-containing protein [Deltaproteobacteria bacterium]